MVLGLKDKITARMALPVASRKVQCCMPRNGSIEK